MKTILFPTDFSKNAANALNYAVEIAGLLSARIVVLYTIRSLADRDTFITKDTFSTPEGAEKALIKLQTDISAKVTCEYIIKKGAITDEIVATTKQQQIDLVIMGTKGAGDVPDSLAMLNSTTANLVSESVCPVLAVPAGYRYQPIRRVVLVVDMDEVEETVLRPFIELVTVLKAEVILLTIVSEKEKVPAQSSKLTQLLESFPFTTHTLTDPDVVEGIQAFIRTHQADLLTVVDRKKNFLQSLFADNISQKLALHTKIPLLTLGE
ncbi:universal stress protein [Rhodocytophaga rosea]|uniref:Universal stress protein n=1 Tax=Rhodocytophaga rosea TaxID=2704465 RepID=A0A6C0GQG2_9BACT|nr:universal stress protein [Rhodocytophaga rosea]QHT70301.1 universal stress protein [Rhodocytophaga rosea]